jgi:hypothetical protein
MDKLEQNDRVSFSYGFKKSDGKYGSKDMHISYSTDVTPLETPEDAMTRAKEFVKSQIEGITGPSQASTPKPIQNHAPVPKADNLDSDAICTKCGTKLTRSKKQRDDGKVFWYCFKGMKSKEKGHSIVEENDLQAHIQTQSLGADQNEEIPF